MQPMKFFIDTANISEIKRINEWGILDGVTTNPSLIAKESGKPFEAIIEEICAIVDGPISAEVIALDAPTMIKEGRALAAIHRNVVVKVPLPLTSAQAFHDTLVAGMTERTKVVFLSHITSPTALLFPIGSVIAEARKRDILSVIDGAHTPGHIPLDLDALGADFYAGNCHKWMMAPKGSGFVQARPEWQAMLDPLVISHGWTADNKEPGVRGPFGNSAFVDEIEMQGTRDPSAWLAVPAAIAFRREHDWWKISADCHRLAQDTAARLREITGLPALSSPEFSAPQMVAMPIPPCDPIAVHDELLSKYGIEIPVFEWQGHFIARLSCQGYNTAAQMDTLIGALCDLLGLQRPQKQRLGM